MVFDLLASYDEQKAKFHILHGICININLDEKYVLV